MRIPTPIQALSAAAALALLAGCSSGSAIAPTMSTPLGHVHSMGHGSSVLNPVGLLKLSQHPITQSHRASFYACSTTARLEYVSDAVNGAVDIFEGGFTAGQTPCGLITGLSEPQGLTVHQGKLYVANTTGLDILRFPRGSTTPDKTYTDSSCSGEYPADVTVDSHGYVFATDIISNGCSGGQISTFKPSGTFLHNYPDANGANDYFLTVQKNDQVYFDNNTFSIYTASCPAGVCGAFTPTGATMAFPGGLRSATGEDVVLDDQSAAGGGALTTFETFPTSSASCPLGAGDPVSYDLNHSDKHAYYADALNVVAGEVKYNDGGNVCAPVATVAMPGQPIGVAVDAPGPLN
jgi:hypothetical protein